MKRETQDLISWFCGEFVGVWQECETADANTVEKLEKIAEVLCKLEEVENVAVCGGYIRDSDGNICKSGDKMRWTLVDGTCEKHGELYWSDETYDFTLSVPDEGDYDYIHDVYEFHKEG